MNTVWGTRFSEFAEVDTFPAEVKGRENEWQRAAVDWDAPSVRGMHYDWCTFNNERVTSYFQQTRESIQRHAPAVSTHVKVMLGNYFTGSTERRGWPMKVSYNTFGIDLESLNRNGSVCGGDDAFPDLAHCT